MNARSSMRARQRGISLVAAIFLLVVLAGLGVFAVRLSVIQAQTTTSSLRAAQAFQAARSGIAWAVQRAIGAGVCGAATLNLSEGGTSGYDVTVGCSQSSHVEAGVMVNVYLIDVLAESGSYGGPDYVSRRLQAKVTDAS